MRCSREDTFLWAMSRFCCKETLCSSAATLARWAALHSSLEVTNFCSSSAARLRSLDIEASCSSASAQRRSALSRSILSDAAPRSICSIVAMIRSLLDFATLSCSARRSVSASAVASCSLALCSCSCSFVTVCVRLSNSAVRRALSCSFAASCSVRVRPSFFSLSSLPEIEVPSFFSLSSSSCRRRTSSSRSNNSEVFSFNSLSR